MSFLSLVENVLVGLKDICDKQVGWWIFVFGAFSKILVGYAVQPPPSTIKTLHNSAPDNQMGMMGYCAYRKFKINVKSLQNQRANILKSCTMQKLILQVENFFEPKILHFFLKVILMIIAFTWHTLMK